MFLTSKALSRRTILRGLGATLALPFLDAMTPALSLAAQRARKPAHRFLAFYVPNGMAMEYWSPKAEGRAFELTPILQPLEPFRDQMTVLSGISANWVAIHAGASGAFLTGTARGGKTEIEIFADTSMDQLLARHYANETQIASLEMAMDRPANAGACTGNLSCVYTHTLSWRSPTQPLPMEWNPRAVFEKLFGDAGSDRPCGARREAAPAQEHPRFGQREAGARCTPSSGRRTGSGSSSTPKRSATSNAGFSGLNNRPISSCRRWISRRARRRSSKITWS